MVDYIHVLISLTSLLLILYIISRFRGYYLSQPFSQNKIYLLYLISIALLGICYFLILIIEQNLIVYTLLLTMNLCFCAVFIFMSIYSDIIFFQRSTFFTYFTIILSATLISAFLFETPIDFIVSHKIDYITYDFSMKTQFQPADFLSSQAILISSVIRLFYILHKITKSIRTEYHFSIYLVFLGFFLTLPGFFLGYLISERNEQLSMIYFIPVIVISFSTLFFLKKPYPFLFLTKNMTYFAISSQNKIMYCFKLEDFTELQGADLEQFDNENSIYLKTIPQLILKNEPSASLSFQLDQKRIIMAIGMEFTIIFILKNYNISYNDLAIWCLDRLKMEKFQSPEFWIAVRKLVNLLN